MELRVEIEGAGGAKHLPGEGSALIAFMSFAVSRGFGAEHPLIALAERLATDHGVRMGPLTTFYEGDIEDAEDAEKLDLAWQDAGGLAESLERMDAALAADRACAMLVERAGASGLAEQAGALLGLAREAAAGQRRIRLSYTL